jgi:hypothetical protein
LSRQPLLYAQPTKQHWGVLHTEPSWPRHHYGMTTLYVYTYLDSRAMCNASYKCLTHRAITGALP